MHTAAGIAHARFQQHFGVWRRLLSVRAFFLWLFFVVALVFAAPLALLARVLRQ